MFECKVVGCNLDAEHKRQFAVARWSGRDGQLLVPESTPLDVPAGQWVHVEMTAGLGPDCTGKWDLAVTLPGAPPRRFAGLSFSHAEFRRLHWLGFCSTANHKTTLSLDNIELTTTKADE